MYEVKDNNDVLHTIYGKKNLMNFMTENKAPVSKAASKYITKVHLDNGTGRVMCHTRPYSPVLSTKLDTVSCVLCRLKYRETIFLPEGTHETTSITNAINRSKLPNKRNK